MEYWEERKYSDLVKVYKSRECKIEELKNIIKSLEEKLSVSESGIVDICHINGVAGLCGDSCPIFGSKHECFYEYYK